MTKVLAGITTSVDGYVAGPNDRAKQGLGEGGERLHYWVFGGPWTYETEDELGKATGEDAAWLENAVSQIGAVVAGRCVGSPTGSRIRRRPRSTTRRSWTRSRTHCRPLGMRR